MAAGIRVECGLAVVVGVVEAGAAVEGVVASVASPVAADLAAAVDLQGAGKNKSLF